MLKALLFLIFTGLVLISCQKQSNLNGNAFLFISADTVSFDTVFASTGSITQKVKLINNNNQDIGISSITLEGGLASSFIINIDGNPGPAASNLNIQAGDSLYVFVTLFIKSGAQPLPFLLRDSIRISYNGKEQFIQLSAWGQNAHFLKNQVIKTDTSWVGDLPYVISGGLTIDSNVTLTIQPGSHIYMHADAAINVNGSLQVLGDTAENLRVLFTGDRLDQPYAGYPGSWPGIYFGTSSRDNILNFTIIQNASHSVVAQGPSLNGNPKLSLSQCIINNSAGEGILGLQTNIKAVNCLISNCGQNIVIGLGGIYQFEQCTAASYSTDLLLHQQPVLTVSNSGSDGNQIFIGDLDASFSNCIFWGSQGIADEALISKQGNTVFNVLFDHTILKQQNYPSNIDSSFLLLNEDPKFISTGFPDKEFNFQLQDGSPALKYGISLGIPIDLNGQPRPASEPDLGCYERQ
jgi:hypothetical protein